VYLGLKKTDLDLPMFIHEARGMPACVFARFGVCSSTAHRPPYRVDAHAEKGVEKRVEVDNLSEVEVSAKVAALLHGFDHSSLLADHSSPPLSSAIVLHLSLARARAFTSPVSLSSSFAVPLVHDGVLFVERTCHRRGSASFMYERVHQTNRWLSWSV
jgi:hypothetical protein